MSSMSAWPAYRLSNLVIMRSPFGGEWVPAGPRPGADGVTRIIERAAALRARTAEPAADAIIGLDWLYRIEYPPAMPELPDVTVYIEALDARIRGARLAGVRLASPFVLR